MITREIAAGDGVLRVRIAGSGPAVLFVHGALADSHLWDGVADALSDRFQVILPDLALGSHTLPLPSDADRSVSGHARRLAALLDVLDLREVTLVGNDSGGVICQLLAADHGERVGRLLLTNCDALDVFPPRAYAYLPFFGARPALMGLLARLLNAAPLLARLPNAYGWLTVSGIDEALLRSWLRPALDPAIREDFAGFCRSAHTKVTLSVAERLCAFPGPVCFAWGTADPFLPLSLAERLASILPDAEIERFDASTYVALDQPEELAACIKRISDVHSVQARAI